MPLCVVVLASYRVSTIATETDKTAFPYELKSAIKIVVIIKWEQDNHTH